MTVQTITLGLHDAFIDPMVGMGFLALPAGEDVYLEGPSLHAVDFDNAMCSLVKMGWTLALDDDDCWIEDGHTPDGRTSFGLCSEDPVVEHPSLDQYAESVRALRETVRA